VEDEDPVVGAWAIGHGMFIIVPIEMTFAARPGGALNPLQTDDATFLAQRSATTGARLKKIYTKMPHVHVGVSWCARNWAVPSRWIQMAISWGNYENSLKLGMLHFQSRVGQKQDIF